MLVQGCRVHATIELVGTGNRDVDAQRLLHAEWAIYTANFGSCKVRNVNSTGKQLSLSPDFGEEPSEDMNSDGKPFGIRQWSNIRIKCQAQIESADLRSYQILPYAVITLSIPEARGGEGKKRLSYSRRLKSGYTLFGATGYPRKVIDAREYQPVAV